MCVRSLFFLQHSEPVCRGINRREKKAGRMKEGKRKKNSRRVKEEGGISRVNQGVFPFNELQKVPHYNWQKSKWIRGELPMRVQRRVTIFHLPVDTHTG